MLPLSKLSIKDSFTIRVQHLFPTPRFTADLIQSKNHGPFEIMLILVNAKEHIGWFVHIF